VPGAALVLLEPQAQQAELLELPLAEPLERTPRQSRRQT